MSNPPSYNETFHKNPFKKLKISSNESKEIPSELFSPQTPQLSTPSCRSSLLRSEPILKLSKSMTGEPLSPIKFSPSKSEIKWSKFSKKKGTTWTKEEDELLKRAVEKYSGKNWKEISLMVPGRTHSQCSQRWRRIQPYKNRQAWTKEEDKILVDLVEKHGMNWSLISGYINGRTGKQVRERYINKLDSKINRNRFSEEEDMKILNSYKKIGAKWREISKGFEGRPENMIKNRFYSYIKRKYLIEDQDNFDFQDEIDEEIKMEEIKEKDDFKEVEPKKFDASTKNTLNTDFVKKSKNKIDQKEFINSEGTKFFFHNDLELNYLMDDRDFSKDYDESFEKNYLNNQDLMIKNEEKETLEEIQNNQNLTSNDPIERLDFLTKKKKIIEDMLLNVINKIQQCEFKKD